MMEVLVNLLQDGQTITLMMYFFLMFIEYTFMVLTLTTNIGQFTLKCNET